MPAIIAGALSLVGGLVGALIDGSMTRTELERHHRVIEQQNQTVIQQQQAPAGGFGVADALVIGAAGVGIYLLLRKPRKTNREDQS